MDNSGLVLFIGGVVVIVFFVMGGVFNLRRHDMKAMEAADTMTATGNAVWSCLTSEQQEELNRIESLLIQEEWIEENVEPSALNDASPERVLIELANRGLVILGQGVFRRHTSPLDFIDPKAPLITDSVEKVEGPLLKEENKKSTGRKIFKLKNVQRQKSFLRIQK